MQLYVPVEHGWPASGYALGRLPEGVDAQAQCGARWSAELRLLEPPAAIRGNIARRVYYLVESYGIAPPARLDELLEQWDLADPPDTAESDVNHWLALRQGMGRALPRMSLETYVEQTLAARHPRHLAQLLHEGGDALLAALAKRPYSSWESSFEVDHYAGLALERGAVAVLQGRPQGWHELAEILAMHHTLKRHHPRPLNRFDVQVDFALFGLAAVVGEDEAAEWYAHQLRNFFRGGQQASYEYRPQGWMRQVGALI